MRSLCEVCVRVRACVRARECMWVRACACRCVRAFVCCDTCACRMLACVAGGQASVRQVLLSEARRNSGVRHLDEALYLRVSTHMRPARLLLAAPFRTLSYSKTLAVP